MCKSSSYYFQNVRNFYLWCSSFFIVGTVSSCGDLTLSGHQLPTKLLCHSPSQQDVNKRQNKIKEIHGSREMWFNKANAKTTEKANENKIYSQLYEQVISSYFSWSRTSVCLVIASENKCDNKCPSPQSLPRLSQLLWLNRCDVVWNIPLISLGQLSWLCLLSGFWLPPA